MKSSKKTVSSYILAFLISLLVAAAILTGGTLVGLLDTKTVEEALTACQYYDNLTQEIKTGVDNILLTSGLEEEMTEDVITREALHDEAERYIQRSLEGKEVSVDISPMIEELQNKIEKYLSKKDIKVDDQVGEGLELMMSEVEETCRNTIENPLFRYIYRYGIRYRHTLSCILAVLAAALLLLHIVLIAPQRIPRRGWNYAAYGWLSGTLLGMLLPVCGWVTGIYDRINVSPGFFRQFLSEYVKQSLVDYLFLAVVGLAVYFVIMICVVHTRNRKNS